MKHLSKLVLTLVLLSNVVEAKSNKVVKNKIYHDITSALNVKAESIRTKSVRLKAGTNYFTVIPDSDSYISCQFVFEEEVIHKELNVKECTFSKVINTELEVEISIKNDSTSDVGVELRHVVKN